MKWKTTKNARKEENKDENLLIMSNVVVFSRINSKFLKVSSNITVLGKQDFIISKYERNLHVKEYNRSYVNENVCMVLLF